MTEGGASDGDEGLVPEADIRGRALGRGVARGRGQHRHRELGPASGRGLESRGRPPGRVTSRSGPENRMFEIYNTFLALCRVVDF